MATSFYGPRMLDIDFSSFTDDLNPKFIPNQHYVDSLGNDWVYVKFAAATAKGDACFLYAYTSSIINVKPTAQRVDPCFGISPIAHTINYYGFLLYRGVLVGDANIISASTAAGDPITPSATGGAMDLALATDIVPLRCVCLVDDTDNTGTVAIR